ncbi:threonine aldolase [Dysgonomonas sp. PFB1-18]|uniref:threonine aldolase family protein n=1 Tax=unclassified Dysgonomonas TaxID=2630389 RepID=UPI0024760622|nr:MULTISPECIES: beta-eliminating lyase-related protein [unclassified Dysgonomonas]MDH6309156.1 threonine aldolase [Dysgonomonas sp. PF1-14]MDH6338964.1 threonine aldolase [Dysgonomonas sp. PF1-16]MDH6380405.1 threonine aldolase [Dysgonomonas sp. PFB1-18]MDH6397792.1 threonine aldolase [Dysgonomonas sp. PF1-23]
MKYSFANDYSEGCHPRILEALAHTNLIQQAGYGDDSHTCNASDTIRRLAGNTDIDVHMVAGGTMANLVVLASVLRPFESVVAATTGHIYTNEAGAIEATGHKVEAAPTVDGKLRPADIVPFLNKARGHHLVRTRAVYISNSTELGTVYTKQELIDLYEFSKANNLILFMDGARLPMALTAPSNDLTLADIARYTDVFYIGGTKCGAMLGEAIVISNPDLKQDFKYHLKQRGALSAKGRTIGIQFEQLLQDNLIFELADHANKMASRLACAFKQLGCPLLIDSDTNQLFPVLSNAMITLLQKDYGFLIWSVVDEDRSAVRLITSWATPERVVDEFIKDLRRVYSVK